MSAYAVPIVQGRIVGEATHVAVRPTVTAIQCEIIREFDLPPNAMISGAHQHRIAWPRQIAMALAYELTNLGADDVAKHFAKRDHGTVLHACKRVRARMDTEPKIRAQIDALRERLA